MNDDFEVNLDDVLDKRPGKAKAAAKPAKVSAKKQAMLDSIMEASDAELDEMPAPVGAIVLDEQGNKRRKGIRIIIDEVAGVKENYEVVGVNGVVYQIKRGVPTEVPPEVVHVLELAQGTHTEQIFNRQSGEYEEVHRIFSAIPWRRA